MEGLGVAERDEPVVRVEDRDERADLAERDAADDEEPLPLADGGVHHKTEDGWGHRPALGDAAPGAERDPEAAGSFANWDTVVPECFDQPPRVGPHSTVLKDLEAAALQPIFCSMCVCVCVCVCVDLRLIPFSGFAL